MITWGQLFAFMFTLVVLGLIYHAGYVAGRQDGAEYYRQREAERMTRTGAT